MTPEYDEPQAVDFTKLRYVLYARKSTEDEARQIRSIPDQLAECETYANRLGIKIVARLQETKSAKKPNNRPVFNQMIKDVQQGKYDGILAWHPDRLARNMREGGELIDLIDEGILRDLRFVTHYFTNDANGKMLLGMAFVLSKHYSDDLSQKVTRGVRRSFTEGKSSGTPKHGYVRTEEGRYEPDGKNFDLICDAWKMRLNNVTYRDIADYVNKNGYGRMVKGKKAKKAGQVLPLDFKRLPDLFRDPFYYGVLYQAGQYIDLRNVPGYNFTPVVTEEEYDAVQALSNTQRKSLKPKERKTYFPLRGLVLCSFCGSTMYAGASRGSKGTRYLNYRCDNKECTRTKKSIRAKEVFNFIYDYLADGLNFAEEDYAKYADDLAGITEKKRAVLNSKLHSVQGALKHVERESKDRSLSIINYKEGTPVWNANMRQIEELETRREDLEAEIKRIQKDLAASEGTNLSVEQFLNLSKSAGTKLEAANPVAKDRICRMIFLNLTVDEQKVVDYQIREPFATLLKTRKILSGRGDRT